MITLLKEGNYKLIETKRHTKILYLGERAFAWVEPVTIGEILVTSHGFYITDCVLSLGPYCLYEVKDEPHLTDQPHLELEAGYDIWQGYLLPTGLPDDAKKRVRIIPTTEVITSNPEFQKQLAEAKAQQ